MATDQKNENQKHIVIARVDTKYEDCRIVPEGNMFPATHFKAFGPASEKECSDWQKKNCSAGKGK